jgi:hypothetical protein
MMKISPGIRYQSFFHLKKAWISTGPVTAENEERCGSALYVEDGHDGGNKASFSLSSLSLFHTFVDIL